MKIKGYELVNEDKLRRVIDGQVFERGRVEGGLGNDAKPEDILAHYDKFAGLILKDGVKVKTGCFWDSKLKKPIENPKPVFITELDGEILEVSEEEAKAVKAVKAQTAKLKAKKAEKNKKDESL